MLGPPQLTLPGNPDSMLVPEGATAPGGPGAFLPYADVAQRQSNRLVSGRLRVQLLSSALPDGEVRRGRRRGVPPTTGGYPSGQRGLTVNQLADAFGGSNPSPPTKESGQWPVVSGQKGWVALTTDHRPPTTGHWPLVLPS